MKIKWPFKNSFKDTSVALIILIVFFPIQCLTRTYDVKIPLVDYLTF